MNSHVEEERKAFGLTKDEAGEIADSVLGWVDSNSPKVPKSKGGTFREAFRFGSEKMKATQFANLFKE